jgi:hypothetical protein
MKCERLRDNCSLASIREELLRALLARTLKACHLQVAPGMSTLVMEPTGLSCEGWLISKREDLTWFIGGSLIGYLAFLGLVWGIPLVPVLIAWSLLIDGPHVLATTSRTYFDRRARQNLGWRLWLIIPLSLIGPAMWMLGLGKVFFVLFITWAQYHIAKQHMGFVMLYKVKVRERTDMLWDKRFVVLSLMLPWTLYLYGMLQLPAPKLIGFVAFTCYVVLVILYSKRQVRRIKAGEAWSLPKLLLLLIVIPLPWLAFWFVSGRPEVFAVAAIATNIGHSLQYQRLMWFHNRNRYAASSRSTVGLAAIVNSRITIYLLTAIVLNLLVAGLPHAALHDNGTWLAMLTGVNMAHYYLDSQIWRVRSDKELARALLLN